MRSSRVTMTNMTNTIYLAKTLVNNLLGKVGLQIVRTSTAEYLVSTEAKYNILLQQATLIQHEKNSHVLEDRVTALEARSEELSIQNVIRYAMKAHWRMVDLIEQVSDTDKSISCPLCGHEACREKFTEV